MNAAAKALVIKHTRAAAAFAKRAAEDADEAVRPFPVPTFGGEGVAGELACIRYLLEEALKEIREAQRLESDGA